MMEELPTEMVVNICKFLPVSDLLRLSETCQLLRAITNDDLLWKTRMINDYPAVYKQLVKIRIIDNLKKKWRDVYKATYEKVRKKYYKNTTVLGAKKSKFYKITIS